MVIGTRRARVKDRKNARKKSAKIDKIGRIWSKPENI